jgi:hypothetical protein
MMGVEGEENAGVNVKVQPPAVSVRAECSLSTRPPWITTSTCVSAGHSRGDKDKSSEWIHVGKSDLRGKGGSADKG